MRVYTLPCVLATLILVLIALPSVEPVQGCAVAPPRNSSVQIADETALIVWDASTKTEHFIRRASFNTEAQDFGFLVPTPTQPELADADDEAFNFLSKLTAPAIVTQPKPASPGCSMGCSAAGQKLAAPAGNVTVLAEKRVGRYDTAVLEADDVDKLSSWLNEHGYEFSPVLKDWVGYYIKAKWKITAFKLAKDDKDAPKVGSPAVRMSFQTERPFFPYREPGDPASAKNTPGSSRLLRVFLVSDKRTKGLLGDRDARWPGQVVWSNRVEAADHKKLVELLKLPTGAAPVGRRLTEFEDHSSPRPGTDDVYFTTSEDQQPVARPPHVQYVSMSLPECAFCYALTACLCLPLLAWRCRRT